MDAAQCLATLKGLGADAAVVSDIVMDPAWRRDPDAVRSCAAATTTNAFRDDGPRRAARARACQWLRNKVVPELRKDWDATIQLGQNDVVETTTTNETSEDAAGDVPAAPGGTLPTRSGLSKSFAGRSNSQARR